MSGQERATFLSGINRDIQRRQLERLTKWAGEVEEHLRRENVRANAHAVAIVRDAARSGAAVKRIDQIVALLAACALGGFWARRRARRELGAMLREAGKSATLTTTGLGRDKGGR